MIDDVDAVDRRVELLASLEIAGHELDARVSKTVRRGAIPDQRANLVAARGEMASEMAAGEPGCAGDEDAHRSATSVTGEPTSLSRPADARTPSRPSVTAREPMRL